MSGFNGSGTFVISGTGLPFVTNTTISSTVANQLNTDLATGLSTCITKDGQTTVTATIPFAAITATQITTTKNGTGASSAFVAVASGGDGASYSWNYATGIADANLWSATVANRSFNLNLVTDAGTVGKSLFGFTRSPVTGTDVTTAYLRSPLFHVYPNATADPAFKVDATTSGTGLQVTSAAAAGGVAVAAISTGTNESLKIDAKGSGTITLGGTSTGNVVISRALTYGGVTLSNSVTGTGNMVLSASPTFTGTPLTSAMKAGTNAMRTGASTSVSTGATTIYTNSAAGLTGVFVMVAGDSGTAGFADLVACIEGGNSVVIGGGTTYGAPSARTYTVSSMALQLAMASGTYTIKTGPFEVS